MGGGNLCSDKTQPGQPGSVLWPLSADLWGGRASAVVFTAKILSKAICDIPAVNDGLLSVGIWDQRAVGMEMGDALVGLQ